jgi:energy-coupling factor transporter ATP-binding protein EcfA2
VTVVPPSAPGRTHAPGRRVRSASRPNETLREFAGYHAGARDADELVDLLGLGAVARTPYRRLSGGERQRLSLAVALVGRPDVLVLDEPTAGLDPEARVVVRGIVADARAAGAAILLTSHDLSDVERLADRIVVIAAGSSCRPVRRRAGDGRGLGDSVPGRPAADSGRARCNRTTRPRGGRAGGGPSRARSRARAIRDRRGSGCAARSGRGTGRRRSRRRRGHRELRTGGGSLEEAYLALVGGEHAS